MTMMERIGRVVFAVAVFGVTAWVGAQVLGETMKPLNMSVTYAAEGELDNVEPIGTEVWEFAADTGYNLYQEEDYRLDLGMAANVYIFDLQDAPSMLQDLDTYSFRLPITAAYTGIDDWMISLTATPGIFWDFEGFDSEDTRMEYQALVAYQVNEGLSIFGGADHEEYFDANRVTPVVGFEWQILDELKLGAALVDAKTSYRVNAKMTLGVSECVNVFAMMQTAGDQWNLEIDGSDYDFFYQATRVGMGLEIGVAPNVWLQIIGGVETNRDAQVQSDGNWVLDDDIDDSPFAQIGLTIR